MGAVSGSAHRWRCWSPRGFSGPGCPRWCSRAQVVLGDTGVGSAMCAGNRHRGLDAEEPVAAAASFALISRARFTWVRRAHRLQLFLVLCSHNARTRLLRKLPGAHSAACVMAGEGGRGQIRGSISCGVCGGAGAPLGRVSQAGSPGAVPIGGALSLPCPRD